MPELELPGVTAFYEQRGDGPDLFWLAGGDQPGSDWHVWQTPAFPDFATPRTTRAASGKPSLRRRRPGPWSCTGRTPPR